MVFFLSDKTNNLESRIQKITPLLKLFTTERNHVVQQYPYTKETKTKPALWNGYQVILHYQPVISCDTSILQTLDSGVRRCSQEESKTETA